MQTFRLRLWSCQQKQPSRKLSWKLGRSQEASAQLHHADRPLSEDRPRIPTYLQSFTVSSCGMFTHTAPVAQIRGNSDTYHATDRSTTVRYRKMTSQYSVTEIDAFPLLCPNGDGNELLDMAEAFQHKHRNGAAGNYLHVDGHMVRLF